MITIVNKNVSPVKRFYLFGAKFAKLYFVPNVTKRGEMAFDPQRSRNLRIKKGLTLRGLAAKLGIKHNTIRRYEKGEIVPKIQRVEQIAEVLGTTADYLMGRTDDPIRLTLNDLSAYEREVVLALRGKDFQRASSLMAEEARKQMGGKM